MALGVVAALICVAGPVRIAAAAPSPDGVPTPTGAPLRAPAAGEQPTATAGDDVWTTVTGVVFVGAVIVGAAWLGRSTTQPPAGARAGRRHRPAAPPSPRPSPDRPYRVTAPGRGRRRR